MASISTLQDTFVSSGFNTGLWTSFTGGSATLANGNGMSTVFPSTTSSSTDGDITSNTAYDLTGVRAFMNVTSVSGSFSTHTDNSFRLRITNTDYLQVQYEAGTLFFQKVVASVQTNITSVTYNGSSHAWWSIRESGGTTFWETSSDGLNWTTQTSQANPIVVTGLTVLIAGTSFGVDTSPRNFTWRYFNTPFSEGPYRHLEVGNLSRAEVAN